MSTDPTKRQAPVPPPEEPPDSAAPPTVQAPVQPAARGWQEPPTQPVPQWPAPPPPPGPAAPRQDPGARQDPEARPGRSDPQPTVFEPAVPPTQWDRPAQPTMHDRMPPTQWDTPAKQQWDTPTQLQPPTTQQPPTQQQPPQQWQQPQPQWQPREPQDAPPAQRGPQPPQAQGPWPPAQPPAQGRGSRRRGRRRPVRRSVMVLFTVIVILILLVIGDRVALAVAENQFASQAQAQGLPVKPSVTIEGFPFLTQLAAKDFNQVDISASNIPVQLPDGAGSITISSVHATIDGLHISGYSSSAKATADHINATAFVSFGALAAAGGIGGGSGITVTQDGANKLKITAGIGGVFSDTEEAQITQTGPQTISIKVLPSSSPVGSLLSSFGSFSFSLPSGVPASLRITGLTLNSQGLTVSAAASNAKLGQ